MLNACEKLRIRCLTYLPGPCDERVLRIRKVLIAASDVISIEEKIPLRPRGRNAETPENLSTSASVQKLAIF